MKRALTALAVVALTLTGCASGNEPTADNVPENTTTADAATTAPAEAGGTVHTVGEPYEVSERGNQIIQVGDTYPLYDADLPVGEFEVVSLEKIDTPKVEHFEYDESLTYYIVEFRAEATSDLVDKIGLTWIGYDEDGYKVNDDVRLSGVGVVDDDDDLPWWVGPGERVRGKVLLALPTETGTFVLKFHGGSMGSSTDFGYEFEAK